MNVVAPRITNADIAAYAPPSADPVRLASVTIKAVDKIGTAAADEIDQTAGAILEAATEIAGMLKDLSGAIRDQSALANERLTEFCGKATTVIEGVRELQGKIAGDAPKTEVERPLPTIIAKGPQLFRDDD